MRVHFACADSMDVHAALEVLILIRLCTTYLYVFGMQLHPKQKGKEQSTLSTHRMPAGNGRKVRGICFKHPSTQGVFDQERGASYAYPYRSSHQCLPFLQQHRTQSSIAGSEEPELCLWSLASAWNQCHQPWHRPSLE